MIVTVADIDCRIEPYEWLFAREEGARIDAHWASRVAALPALFDGRVLVANRLAVASGRLVGSYFETAYRAFLSWRDFGFPGAAVQNGFAMPALRAADGAFMLGEMNAGTANAGKLYFPAGTPEPRDAGPDGRIDFSANILRELEEETGLRPEDVTLEADWTVVFAGPLVACMKIVHSSLGAAALCEHQAAFNATQAHPELTRLVPVRATADLGGALVPDFMLRYLRHVLGET